MIPKPEWYSSPQMRNDGNHLERGGHDIFRTIFELLKEKEEECFVGVFDIMQRFNIHDEVEIFKKWGSFTRAGK